MLAKLETLPWLALSRICEYLDDDDDDYDTRSDLRAFSLTSRQCCAATASRRYCEVRVAVTSADDLVRGLEQWAEMLDRDGGRYRYVQRLKVILPDHNKAKRGRRSGALGHGFRTSPVSARRQQTTVAHIHWNRPQASPGWPSPASSVGCRP